MRYECPTSPFKQNAGQLPGRGLAKIPASLDFSPVAQPHLPSSLWFRVQKLLSGPWVPGGSVSGQALAVAPDGKLLFSGGHWDGSLRVTSLPRGRLLNQLSRHLGMSSPGASENDAGRCGMGFRVGPGRTQHLCMSSPSDADVVTCLALDTCGIYLISGSRDTTCMVWRLLQQVCMVGRHVKSLSPRPEVHPLTTVSKSGAPLPPNPLVCILHKIFTCLSLKPALASHRVVCRQGWHQSLYRSYTDMRLQ